MRASNVCPSYIRYTAKERVISMCKYIYIHVHTISMYISVYIHPARLLRLPKGLFAELPARDPSQLCAERAHADGRVRIGAVHLGSRNCGMERCRTRNKIRVWSTSMLNNQRGKICTYIYIHTYTYMYGWFITRKL